MPVSRFIDCGDREQVGAELENPFGTDDNDFPLLHMGLGLVDNMDSMLRTMHNRHQAVRLQSEKTTRRCSYMHAHSHAKSLMSTSATNLATEPSLNGRNDASGLVAA